MKKILIIEDEKSLLEALTQKFTKEGYEIVGAKDGEEGLRIALEEKPDLILLDIILPKMDGMTMLKELRKDGWGKDAKVIVLTNLTDARKAEEAAQNKVYDFLVKSNWTLEEVVDMIKEILS